MKNVLTLLGSALFAISLSANAEDAAQTSPLLSAESLNILRVAPCKASGDGTYTEMITTMASVLPPAAADALLSRYCDECNKKKFAAASPR